LLKIAFAENTPAPVGAVMAWIGQPGEALPEAGPPEPAAVLPVAVPAAKTKRDEQEEHGGKESGFLSPVVRKVAAEHGVDLSQVRGSGLGGRITKQDVLSYVQGGAKPAVQAAAVIRSQGDRLLPHSVIRKAIAERMQISKQTSPHVLTVMEADVSRVAAHRQANQSAFAGEGLRLTYTAYLIAAIAAGLKDHPLANSSWTEQGVLIHARINIGMATSLGEEGLIVPVIRNAGDLSLAGIARAVNDLANRARTKKLQPEEVRVGTFTLTNHGISGSLFAMPIINQPQCGILGAGAIQKRTAVVTDANGEDAIAVRPMLYLSYVFDHRILDGASADAFLAKVKDTLEKWG
jgi:2-oxoglutarate dehydrogenase E2 component (dihydrolipoamide succinyltransferase)